MLKRRQLQAIQRLLQSNAQKVKASLVWKEINEVEGIGEVSGEYICFTHSELGTLRKLIENIEGVDLREQQLEGTRTEVAGFAKNEKLSNEAPFASCLLLATRSSDGVPLKPGSCECPSKGFLGVSLEDIDLSEVKQLVLIENGQAFRDWHLYQFPEILSNALFVYRGHGSNAQLVKQLFQSLSDDSLKVGFFDFDPAGIDMAHDGNFDAVIFPYFWNDKSEIHLDKIQAANKSSVIAVQQNKIGDRYLSFTSKLKLAYEFIENESFSLTQEGMASLGASLTMVRLDKD